MSSLRHAWPFWHTTLPVLPSCQVCPWPPSRAPMPEEVPYNPYRPFGKLLGWAWVFQNLVTQAPSVLARYSPPLNPRVAVCPVLHIPYAASLWYYQKCQGRCYMFAVCILLHQERRPALWKVSLLLQPWDRAALSSPPSKEAAALTPEQASSSSSVPEARSWA